MNQTGITWMMDLPNVNQVADYVLAMSKLDNNQTLDPLQLNKPCYLVNGFVLRDCGEAILSEWVIVDAYVSTFDVMVG